MSETDASTRPVWPHLENLERIQVESPEWLTTPTDWVVTEKLHGFCGRFGVDADGVPWVGSRNNVVEAGALNFPEENPEWPRDELQGFVGYAAEHVVFLKDGETLFGEWAGKGIQKGIDYGKPDFYAFGLMRDGALVAWDDLARCCEVGDIKTVPVLYRGSDIPPIACLADWRVAKSLIAETSREGICIAKDPPVREAYGHYLIGKFKSPEFAERARERNRTSPNELPDMTNLQNFVDDYATDERFVHVIDLVAEELRGQFDNAHKDPMDVVNTGRVLQEMYQDVVREAGQEYEELADSDKKMLGKVLNTTTKRMLDAARLAALGGTR